MKKKVSHSVCCYTPFFQLVCIYCIYDCMMVYLLWEGLVSKVNYIGTIQGPLRLIRVLVSSASEIGFQISRSISQI